MKTFHYKKSKFNYFLIAFFFITYFLGFYVRENSNGGGPNDLGHIWAIINDFQINPYLTIKYYKVYEEATFPFFHIIQSFLNPFKSSYYVYCLSLTILNSLIVLLFFIFLRKKFGLKFKNSIMLISSIILLSPWFRSSSFWGLTENLALFFLIPTYYYLNKIIEKNDKSITTNITITILISLTIYSRQTFLFLPIFHLIILFFFIKNRKITFVSLIIYTALAIPGIYTMNIWFKFNELKQSTHAFSYVSINNVIANIPKIASILFFYTAPFFFLSLKKISKIILEKKNIILLLTIYALHFFIYENISYSELGGGYLIKLNRILFGNNIYFILLVSSLFFFLSIKFFSKKNKIYYILLLIYFFINSLTEFVFQETFDPHYVIFIYLLLPKKIIKDNNLMNYKSIYTLQFFQVAILITAIFYYHYYLNIPFFSEMIPYEYKQPIY